MPIYSWIKYLGGSQGDPILHFSTRRCLSMQRWLVHHGSPHERISLWDLPGPLQPSPERSPQVGVSAMGLLTPEMMLKEILALYQEVYQLKSDPGGVQCSTCAAEEAYAEILEVLKACLWHRRGFSQLEEPRWAPSTWPEVKYHDQT